MCVCVWADWRCESLGMLKKPGRSSFVFHFLRLDSCRNSIKVHLLQESSTLTQALLCTCEYDRQGCTDVNSKGKFGFLMNMS